MRSQLQIAERRVVEARDHGFQQHGTGRAIGQRCVVDGVHGKDRKWLSDLACCYGMKTFSINQKPNRYKMFVSNLSVKEIEEFCNEYAPSLGTVINVYGDPKRQFAGAVVEGSYVRKD